MAGLVSDAAARRYGPMVYDHYLNPRNVGVLSDAGANIGTGLAGAPEQGGVIRVQIQVDASGIIERIRFKAYGCGSTIAAASWATQSLEGGKIQQALELSSKDIVDALALPPVKTYGAMLVCDAVRAAVDNYRKKQE